MNLFGLYRLMEYFISEFSLFQTILNGGNAWESNLGNYQQYLHLGACVTIS